MLDRSVQPPYGEVKYLPFKQVEKENLPSGIPIYFLNAGEQPVVRFELKLKSGSWYESQKAVAWFTAKMLQEGTSKKTANEISQAFESYGAFLDIEPGFDQVSISVYGMQRNFTDVLSLLLELLHSPSFAEKELDLLKEIRADEIKSNDAKSNMLAAKKIRESLFGLGHPYGKALLDSDINAINQSLVSNYYKSSFFKDPEIFVSGRVDDSLIRWIGQNFQIPTGVESKNRELMSPISTPKIYIEKEGSLQSSIRLGWHSPKIGSPDYFDFLISTTVLGGYFGSRLMKNIREDKGYTYGISAYPVNLRQSSFCIIGTDVKGEHTKATLDEIFKEIEKLKSEPTQPKEIEMVVNYLAGKFQSSLSTPFKIMDKFTKIHAAGLDYDHFEAYFDSLKSFSDQKLKHSISKHFDLSDIHQVVVGQLQD